MKVLIMNDFLISGGAEMQGIREKKLLEERGHIVYLLTFDTNFPENDLKYNFNNGFINIPIKKSNVKKLLNSFGILKVNYFLSRKIQEIIKDISPDIIHVNNLMQDSFTQYKSLEGYNVVQTIRDYVAVCPLGTCINGKKICSGENYNNCYEKCGETVKNNLKIKLNKNRNKFRKKYITRYICPSQNLTQYCRNNNYNIICINNPFDFNKFSNLVKKVDFNNKVYLYYGSVNKNKGVMNLVEAFKEFAKNINTKLLIAGEIYEDVKEEFEKVISVSNNVEYLGILKYEDMINVLERIHTIVVPSVWMENYPNTVLEGLATKTFVIGSTRGGIPEMLNNDRGLTFDVNSKEEIIIALQKSYNLSKEEYQKIVEKNKKYVEENNSLSKYYDRLMKEFDNIINK